MTTQTAITPDHKTIFAALAAAQIEMGRALKQATNPHFRAKYADLGNVMDACMPALNAHGIAVIQPIMENEHGRYVNTVFLFSDGERIECPVPLIVQKQDMQGLGSAITYARRYGLMSLAGIAPEDDDGNAAVKAAPTVIEVRTVSPDQFIKLRDMAEQAGVSEADVCAKVGAASLEQFPADKFQGVVKGLTAKIESANPNPDPALEGDEIPY